MRGNECQKAMYLLFDDVFQIEINKIIPAISRDYLLKTICEEIRKIEKCFM